MPIPLDYPRSFITFETLDRVNNARIQVEALCRLSRGEQSQDFYLVASCKAEDTYGTGELFLTPNYDFCCIFSEGDYQIIRTHAITERGGRETGRISDRFHQVRFALAPARGWHECGSAAEIAAATLSNRPLVGRTEVDLGNGFHALLEYPVKTMNANVEQSIWQVDTGPLLLPDPERLDGDPISSFDLAFVAFNRTDWAEFILRRPEPVAPSAPMVEHYGSRRALPARNSILALE